MLCTLHTSLNMHRANEVELQQWVASKREILRLAEIKNNFEERYEIESLIEPQQQIVNVLTQLHTSIQEAYYTAINPDSNEAQKREIFDEVKRQLNDTETRKVINTHRDGGTKKIIINILLGAVYNWGLTT